MTRVELNPNIYIGSVDGETYLLDTQSQRRLRLNATGGTVWELLKAGRTPDEITAGIRERFPEVPEDRISGDVSLFVDSIVKTGFACGSPD
ncbi:MAG: PqqD family protein [Clostridia bacterium]|nr:PqqD family protein [Clostridia bacterium]